MQVYFIQYPVNISVISAVTGGASRAVYAHIKILPGSLAEHSFSVKYPGRISKVIAFLRIFL